MAIIDLGGTIDAWRRAPVKPAHVVVVNVARETGDPPSWIQYVRGDACSLPKSVKAERFDLVYSNSVIEHLGGHARRSQFAENVASLAPRHWIQTPYRYFPVEPHWLFPGFQFLPAAGQARVYRWWPLVHTPPSDHRKAVAAVLNTELLGMTEMQHYFPDSDILRERVGPFVKSVIAVLR